jgi:hypothetical protein
MCLIDIFCFFFFMDEDAVELKGKAEMSEAEDITPGRG